MTARRGYRNHALPPCPVCGHVSTVRNRLAYCPACNGYRPLPTRSPLARTLMRLAVALRRIDTQWAQPRLRRARLTNSAEHVTKPIRDEGRTR